MTKIVRPNSGGKKPFAGVPRVDSSNASQNAMINIVEELAGQRGNGGNRALLVSDLVNLDAMMRRALVQSTLGNDGNGLPASGGGVESPHAPQNVTGSGGFTFIAIMWDPPTYQGHAHAEIFRAENDDFSAAVRIATEVTDIFSDVVDMGAGYYYWVKFVNKADMVGPTQGANGIYVQTQNSASQILDQLGGQIDVSHLGQFLTSQIGEIPQLAFEIGELQVEIPEILIEIGEMQVQIPPMQVDIEDYRIDINNLKVSNAQFSEQIPELQSAMFDTDGLVSAVKSDALEAKSNAFTALSVTESMAASLVDMALSGAEVMDANRETLIEMKSSIGSMQVIVDSQFYTITAANEVIAAAVQTMTVTMEENGYVLSGSASETYYTKVTADSAIALKTNELQALIEDPNGTSIGATLNNDYYTEAGVNFAISAESQTLKSAIEDPAGDSVGATLVNSYYTQVATNAAISSAIMQLQSSIEDPLGNSLSAILANSYYTITNTDAAIASATTLLKSEIEDPLGSSLGATLKTNYNTRAEAGQVIANANMLLQAMMENPDGTSLGATIFNHYSAQANVNETTSKSISELSATFTDTVMEGALADGEAAEQQRQVAANMLEKNQAVANAQQALVESVKVLEVQYNDNVSNVVELTTSIAGDMVSTSQKLLQLNSSIGAVSAGLETNYYTQVDTNGAIASATTLIKAEIEDPDGNSVAATLYQHYYTQATTDAAIASATLQLQATLEDLDGSSIAADIYQNYSTTVSMTQAIASATLVMLSQIENPNGNSLGAYIQQNLYTAVDTDGAIAASSEQLSAVFTDTIMEGALADGEAAEQQRYVTADIVNQQTVTANAQKATAKTVTAMQVQYDDNIANVTKITQSLASNVQSTTKDMNLLSSSINGVTADLLINYQTTVESGFAMASADMALQAEIENPNGTSLGAYLQTNYYTMVNADGAIASATTQLKAEIEDPNGTSIAADLYLHYSTTATMTQAMSSADLALQAIIEDPYGSSLGAHLQTNYLTLVGSGVAISSAITQLKAEIENPDGASLGADLFQYYYTSVTTNTAIAAAITALRVDIENPDGTSIGADLQIHYYTSATTDAAISTAILQLKAAVEDPLGLSIAADIYQNYSTTATMSAAIAAADLALQTLILDPDGNSLGAHLQTNYSTTSTIAAAIATAKVQLKSEIENPDGNSVAADLVNNYHTAATINSAIAAADTALRVTIGGVESNLQNNYHTNVTTDAAISSATNQLKVEIEDPNGTSLGADLYNNYYTATSADSAIAAANAILKATIEDADGNSLGATLQVLAQAVANLNGELHAMWGVKLTVGDITSSFGLINDGIDPIFAIKGAKFAVITEQDPTVLTPVFGVIGGQTVIKEALIDVAYIQSLITDAVLANRVIVGAELRTPSINYDQITGVRSNNFSIDPNGNMEAHSATLKNLTIIQSDGRVILNSNGLSQTYIKELLAGQIIASSIYADNIYGDISGKAYLPYKLEKISDFSQIAPLTTSSKAIFEANIDELPFNMSYIRVVESGSFIYLAEDESSRFIIDYYLNDVLQGSSEGLPFEHSTPWTQGITSARYVQPMMFDLPATGGNVKVKMRRLGLNGSSGKVSFGLSNYQLRLYLSRQEASIHAVA